MSGNGAGPPALSVVLVTDELSTVRTTVRHVVEQTVADRIELVLVHPRSASFAVDEQGLWGVRTVEVESIDPLADARAAGTLAAAAAIVAYGETHCYPQPGWAEALLAAHEREVAAVGPVLTNANPSSAIGWANFLSDYGPWAEVDEAGPRDDLPGHNSSYKRALLLDYGTGLGARLRAEFFLHADLRAKGHVLWLEPAMRAGHLNVTLRSSWLPERFWSGRAFGAARARGWPFSRRLVFAAAAPLIPVVRAYRSVPDWRRCSRRSRLPRLAAPALLAGFVVSAAGELAGYLTGPGRSTDRLAEIELHREAHLAGGPPATRPGGTG